MNVFLKSLAPLALTLSIHLLGADGLYVGEPLEKASASVEQGQMVLRLPVSRAVAPKARGILLVDTDPGLKLASDGGAFWLEREGPAQTARYKIHVVLREPVRSGVSLQLVLNNRVFWNVACGDRIPKDKGGWLSFPVEVDQDPGATLQSAGALFGVPEQNRHDLRLTTAQRGQMPRVEGEISQAEIVEIRQTTFLMGRRSILGSLLRADLTQWPEILDQWPGQHPLRISVGKRQAAVYYAPNAGYQFEKRGRRWAIVGG